MADLMYGRIKQVWGEDSFIETDYRGYLSDNNVFDFDTNEKIAGLVLYNEDTYDTVSSFIDFCIDAKPTLIMVEYSNLTDVDAYRNAHELFIEALTLSYMYEDLESYEHCDAFGLKPEYR